MPDNVAVSYRFAGTQTTIVLLVRARAGEGGKKKKNQAESLLFLIRKYRTQATLVVNLRLNSVSIPAVDTFSYRHSFNPRVPCGCVYIH